MNAVATKDTRRDDRGQPLKAGLRLEWRTLPQTFTVDVYAWAMSISPSTARRQAAFGTCEVAPTFIRPHRWRKADVQRYLFTGSVVDRRRTARASAPPTLL